jgi:hypothetical protein
MMDVYVMLHMVTNVQLMAMFVVLVVHAVDHWFMHTWARERWGTVPDDEVETEEEITVELSEEEEEEEAEEEEATDDDTDKDGVEFSLSETALPPTYQDDGTYIIYCPTLELSLAGDTCGYMKTIRTGVTVHPKENVSFIVTQCGHCTPIITSGIETDKELEISIQQGFCRTLERGDAIAKLIPISIA